MIQSFSCISLTSWYSLTIFFTILSFFILLGSKKLKFRMDRRKNNFYRSLFYFSNDCSNFLPVNWLFILTALAWNRNVLNVKHVFSKSNSRTKINSIIILIMINFKTLFFQGFNEGTIKIYFLQSNYVTLSR